MRRIVSILSAGIRFRAMRAKRACWPERGEIIISNSAAPSRRGRGPPRVVGGRTLSLSHGPRGLGDFPELPGAPISAYWNTYGE